MDPGNRLAYFFGSNLFYTACNLEQKGKEIFLSRSDPAELCAFMRGKLVYEVCDRGAADGKTGCGNSRQHLYHGPEPALYYMLPLLLSGFCGFRHI